MIQLKKMFFISNNTTSNRISILKIIEKKFHQEIFFLCLLNKNIFFVQIEMNFTYLKKDSILFFL